MKIMISQPMNGKSNEQIKKERLELVQNLEQEGIEVIDNILSQRAPKNFDEAIFYLSKSIEIMAQVDCVYFMKGWEKARGCKIEHQIATEYGKQMKYEI